MTGRYDSIYQKILQKETDNKRPSEQPKLILKQLNADKKIRLKVCPLLGDKMKKLMKTWTIIMTLCLGLTLLTPPPAGGVPPLQAKQAEKEKVLKEIEALDNKLEAVIEKYNESRVRLEEINKELLSSRQLLEWSEAELEVQKELMEARLVDIYKHGRLDILAVLLNTKSFNDFLVRLSFLMEISYRDVELLEKIEKERATIEDAEARVQDLREKQLFYENDIKAKKTEIEKKLEERQNFLLGLNLEIRQLLAEQVALTAKEKAALLKKIFEELEKANLNPQPGTVIYTAMQYIGVPYLWGGASPSGFDCSGLVMYVFAQHGVKLPHYSGYQFKMGTPVPVEDLQPGDCVFFGNPVHHVGIYAGGGYFIHAPRTGDFVRLTLLSERTKTYNGARRYPAKNLPAS